MLSEIRAKHSFLVSKEVQRFPKNASAASVETEKGTRGPFQNYSRFPCSEEPRNIQRSKYCDSKRRGSFQTSPSVSRSQSLWAKWRTLHRLYARSWRADTEGEGTGKQEKLSMIRYGYCHERLRCRGWSPRPSLIEFHHCIGPGSGELPKRNPEKYPRNSPNEVPRGAGEAAYVSECIQSHDINQSSVT